MDSTLLAITALIGALGVAIKQIFDVREIKNWICYKNPCSYRDGDAPGSKIRPPKK